jgi:hypothetical protein
MASWDAEQTLDLRNTLAKNSEIRSDEGAASPTSGGPPVAQRRLHLLARRFDLDVASVRLTTASPAGHCDTASNSGTTTLPQTPMKPI